MAVKPDESHVIDWDAERLVLTLGWEDELNCTQQASLPRLRKHLMDMDEVQLASPTYTPQDKDGYRLRWVITYEAVNVENHNDAQRQHLEELIETTIQRVVFGGVKISEKGVVTDDSVTRPARTHVV